MEEVNRIEDKLRVELQDQNNRAAFRISVDTASSADGSTLAPDGERRRAGRAAATDAEVRQYLEKHKENVRAEAMVAVRRHREHLNALRAMHE